MYFKTMLYTQKDIASFGSILGIWAHPDDECWASAGLMRLACMNDQKVGIVTATSGASGLTADETKWPKSNLGEIRKKELESCLCNVGSVEQFWLGYMDGKLNATDESEASERIAGIINLFNPDTIVTFEPNGITGHDDHKTISRWAELALEESGRKALILHAYQSKEKYEEAGRELDTRFNIFFNTDQPKLVSEGEADILIELDDGLLDCKVACVKAHKSQTQGMFEDQDSRKRLSKMCETECFVRKIIVQA